METLDVAVGEGRSVADLEAELVQRYPDIRPYAGVWRVALNQRYVKATALACPGDEIVLITPVSGG